MFTEVELFKAYGTWVPEEQEEIEIFDVPADRWCTLKEMIKQYNVLGPRYGRYFDIFYRKNDKQALMELKLHQFKRALIIAPKSNRAVERLCRHSSVGELVALERSTTMLQSQQLSTSKVAVVCGDYYHFPFQDETFDLIYNSGYLLDTCTISPTNILREMQRVVKRDGLIVFTVMTSDTPYLIHRLANWFYVKFLYEFLRPIWQNLWHGYAPHSRPIALREQIDKVGLVVVLEKLIQFLVWPLRVYYLKRGE